MSDPHLSFARAKPMHVFGEHWRGHWEKIDAGWRRCVRAGDVVLVTGDVSWGRAWPEGLPDLEWLHRLPGRKLMVRGNHDQWWPRRPRERQAVPGSITLLDGEAVEHGGAVFCGAGGWLSPQDPYFDALDHKPYQRELDALDRALERAAALEGGRGIHVLLHFPPYTSSGVPTAFDRLLRRYPVRTVTFGHFHYPAEWARTPRGPVDGIHYTLASADFVDFTPVAVPNGHGPPGR